MPYETIIDPVVTLSMDEGRFEEGLVEAFKIFPSRADGMKFPEPMQRPEE